MTTPPKKIGSWIRGRVMQDGMICLECKGVLPRGTPAWRSMSNGSASAGRRLCEPCQDRRQAVRRSA